MQIKSWHLASAGLLIYISASLFYLTKGALQDCALVGDCIGCGGGTGSDCVIGSIGSNLDYLLFVVFITLVPALLLRAAKTRKVGAVLNILLGLLFIGVVSASSKNDAIFYDYIFMLLPACFFLSAGACFFLRENGPGK